MCSDNVHNTDSGADSGFIRMIGYMIDSYSDFGFVVFN